MRALVAERPGEVSLCELPRPTAGPGEVVVRVRAALTCGTDFKQIRRGHPKVPFPAVLGHEFAGIVEEAGDGALFRPGERVTSAVSGPCGDCPDCRAGEENLCSVAFDQKVWGAFADFIRIPRRVVERGLRRLPDGLSFPAAALLDPLASVVRGVARSGVPPGARVLLAGSGPIALLFTILLGRAGARVLAAGRRDLQLAALRRSGAETVDLRTGSLAERTRDFTEGRGPRLVVDTTGSPELVAELAPLVGKGGTLQLFAGLPKDARMEIPLARIHYDEISVTGSFHYTPDEADRALGLLVSGAVPEGELISARRPLADFAEVFRDLSHGDAMKTALVP